MTGKPSKARLAELEKKRPRTASPEEIAALVAAGKIKATSLTWSMAHSNSAALRVVSAAEQRSSIGKTANNQVGGWDGLIDQLDEFSKRLRQNDLTVVEDMLMGQAVALQAMFVRLTEGAFAAESLSNYDMKLRYALRAQSQCRATLESLATVKNPPVLFARQANVSTGPQQVNNGTINHQAPPSRAETETGQNEQSGDTRELLQDGRTSPLAIPANPPLAAVGEIDRPRTSAGKARSSRNAWKGGLRPSLRALAKLLREQKQSLTL